MFFATHLPIANASARKGVAGSTWSSRVQLLRCCAKPPRALKEIYASFVEDGAMLAMLVQERPKVVSFHFGLPSAEKIAALRNAGIVLLATATNLAEGQAIARAGIDAVVAQGYEAGGHRGTFDPELLRRLSGHARIDKDLGA